jgi:hypothetical protein
MPEKMIRFNMEGEEGGLPGESAFNGRSSTLRPSGPTMRSAHRRSVFCSTRRMQVSIRLHSSANRPYHVRGPWPPLVWAVIQDSANSPSRSLLDSPAAPVSGGEIHTRSAPPAPPRAIALPDREATSPPPRVRGPLWNRIPALYNRPDGASSARSPYFVTTVQFGMGNKSLPPQSK